MHLRHGMYEITVFGILQHVAQFYTLLIPHRKCNLEM